MSSDTKAIGLVSIKILHLQKVYTHMQIMIE